MMFSCVANVDIRQLLDVLKLTYDNVRMFNLGIR